MAKKTPFDKYATDITTVINNKYVTIGIGILAIFNMGAYFWSNNSYAIFVFALTGLITSIFTKSLTSILLIAMVFANTFMYGNIFREGLTNDSDASEDENGQSGEASDITNADEVGTNDGDADSNSRVTTIKNKIKSKIQNQQSDTESSGSPKPSTAQSSAKNEIDKYSTTEEAYANLDSMLGPGGLKSLSAETKTIMESQKNMIENMRSMQPLIQQAQSLLKSLNMNGSSETSTTAA